MMNNKGGSFFAGFLWGIIIGAALVFFLGTKKGKRLLKVISEEGLELSELLGADEVEDLEEDVEYISPKKKAKKVVNVQEPIEEASEIVKKPNGNGNPIKKIISPARRFFRGIPKKN